MLDKIKFFPENGIDAKYRTTNGQACSWLWLRSGKGFTKYEEQGNVLNWKAQAGGLPKNDWNASWITKFAQRPRAKWLEK